MNMGLVVFLSAISWLALFGTYAAVRDVMGWL